MRYISILGIPFRKPSQLGLLFVLLLVASAAHAVLLERVVATIDDSPVLLTEVSEFREALSFQTGQPVDEMEALERLIDRKVLLMEARRLRLDKMGTEPLDEQAQIDRYIDIVIRTFVPGADQDKSIRPSDDRRGINSYSLTGRENGEQQVKRKLAEKIEALRREHKINIYLDDAARDGRWREDTETPMTEPSDTGKAD